MWSKCISGSLNTQRQRFNMKPEKLFQIQIQIQFKIMLLSMKEKSYCFQVFTINLQETYI